jgi:hypothetical protein
MEKKVLYFEKSGKENTDRVLRLARERAEELKIDQVVVASSHGHTAKRAKAILGDLGVKLVAVTICHGWASEGWTMSDKERKALEEMGITVLTGVHALGDDVNEAFGAQVPNVVVRDTLYRFCQGMKVAVEVALMAADAGVIDTSREAIAVGGTNAGADTAIVVKPACTRKFKEFEIRELLAKPIQG